MRHHLPLCALLLAACGGAAPPAPTARAEPVSEPAPDPEPTLEDDAAEPEPP